MMRTLCLVLTLFIIVPSYICVPVTPQHIRRTRSVSGVNKTISPYVEDLFRNMSKTDATGNTPRTNNDLINSVKTFTNVADAEDHLKFNLSEIKTTEVIIRTVLRVHLQYSGQLPATCIAHLDHKNGSKITNLNISKEWVEFQIAPVISEWVKRQQYGLHEFKIRIGCGDYLISITTSTSNLDKQPLLVVSTYDSTIDSSSFFKNIWKLMDEAGTAANTPTPTTTVTAQRTSRSASGNCKKHVIEVQTDWLNRLNIIDFGKFVLPTSYQANICGGSCSSLVPRDPAHSVLFHLLVTHRGTSQPFIPGARYTKCCVPIRYNNLSFLVEGDAGIQPRYQVFKIANGVVSECGCIYVKE